MFNKKVGVSKCRALCHADASLKYPSLSEDLVNVFNTKKVESKICTLFKTNKFLNLKTAEKKFNVCKKCIFYVSNINLNDADHNVDPSSANLNATTSTKNTSAAFDLSGCDLPASSGASSKDISCSVKGVIQTIRNDQLTTEELQSLAFAVGQQISLSIKKDANCIASADRNKLLTVPAYSTQWDGGTNVILKSFFEGIVNLSSKSNEEQLRRKTCLVKATQALYSAVNMKFVSPLALSENLVSYYYSGSKSVCQIFGSHMGGGSYRTVQRMINDIGTTITHFPKGDVWVCFDNQQIVGKQYRWSYGNRQPVSVVTSVCTFSNTQSTKYQYQPMKRCFFDPYRIKSAEGKTLMQKYVQMMTTASKVNGQYRHDYFTKLLTYVAQQCSSKNKQIGDTLLNTEDVDDNIGLLYERVPATKGYVTIRNQEVILVNPNSKKTIIAVLKNLQRKSKEADPQRKWFVMTCDGLPASIIYNLLPNTYTCKNCNDTVYNDRYVRDGINSFDHSCDIEVTKGHRRSFALTFNDIVLRPGNGHYEMTFTKCILEILFELYFSAMCTMFNIKSPKAIEFVRKSHDHHRSWQFLRILISSLSSELCFAYYSFMGNLKDKSIESFRKWAEHNKNPNIFLAYVVVVSVLHPLFLFRAAIRQCASQTAFLIREKLSALFFGTNHGKYRLITVYDAFLNLSIEEQFQQYIQVESVRRPNAEYGESFDFQLENENKIMKRLVNYGVPSAAEWTKISNGMDAIQQVKSETMKRLSIEIDKPVKRKVDLRKEITEFRKIIRLSEIFAASESTLKCLNNDSVIIDPEFSNFFIYCETNRDKFYKDFLDGKKTKLIYMNYPGFVAKAPLSYDELCKSINESIKNLPEPFETQYRKRFLVLKNKKDVDDLNEFKSLLENEIEECDSMQSDAYVSNSN